MTASCHHSPVPPSADDNNNIEPISLVPSDMEPELTQSVCIYQCTDAGGSSFLYGMDNLGNVMPIVQDLENFDLFSDFAGPVVIIADTTAEVDVSMNLAVDSESPSLSKRNNSGRKSSEKAT